MTLVQVPLSGNPSRPVWTADIDWVTYIARDFESIKRTEDAARSILDDFGSPADKVRPFRLGRYEGWSTPALRLGRSGASTLVQVSGTICAASWTRLVPCGGMPTRLDVQVSLALPSSRPRFLSSFLRPSTRIPPHQRSSSKLRGLRSDNRGLALGTVGDRTDPRYGRVYDKGVEQKSHEKGVFWRVEIEAKAGLARNLWRDLMGAKDVQSWAFDTVSQQWKLLGCCWPLGGERRGVRGVAAYERRDMSAERLEKWARLSVAPAIQRLIALYGVAGVRAILNLDNPYELPDSQAN
jgi:hypothetical protein